MITTISPASSQYEETVNTLKYANRAKVSLILEYKDKSNI